MSTTSKGNRAELSGKLQWVWWGFRDMYFGFRRFDADATDLALIYHWCLWIGPLEIRRWA